MLPPGAVFLGILPFSVNLVQQTSLVYAQPEPDTGDYIFMINAVHSDRSILFDGIPSFSGSNKPSAVLVDELVQAVATISGPGCTLTICRDKRFLHCIDMPLAVCRV